MGRISYSLDRLSELGYKDSFHILREGWQGHLRLKACLLNNSFHIQRGIKSGGLVGTAVILMGEGDKCIPFEIDDIPSEYQLLERDILRKDS